jgi:drug/metabolite transporter (DMT)-like permease
VSPSALTTSPRTLVYLTLPPLMWAGNAVVGRLLLGHQLPPVTMNAMRWALVALLLAPMARGVWSRGKQVRAQAAYLMLTGMLGVGSYNALQYLALQTASPLSVTLIASSMPVWMMLVGAMAYGRVIQRRQAAGAALSIGGVVLVMCKGRWHDLIGLHWAPGDLLMLLAALAWSVYSWLLAQPPKSVMPSLSPTWHWAEFLWLQVVCGLAFAVMCSSLEWQWLGVQGHGPNLAFMRAPSVWVGLAFIAVGPSILAYWAWGQGVKAVGPTLASFFNNLTPVFAAVWSWALLGQVPQWYHPVALVLIAAGIWMSSSVAGKSKPETP